MLKLFKTNDIRVTWATVGLLLFQDKADLLAHLPEIRPTYRNPRLNLYSTLDEVGRDERNDPYHFGYSLVRQIQETVGMEIASHTFGHFNCLEAGATPEAFRSDLEMAKIVFANLGIAPQSIVFPRNEYDAVALGVARDAGFQVYRSNPAHRFFVTEAQSQEGKAKRFGRWLDSYVNVAGHLLSSPGRDCGMVNVPASRFLRPFSRQLAHLDGLRVMRITNSMTAAAIAGLGFHLWWHPHNFGSDFDANMGNLQKIVRHFLDLRERYGMRSMTMSDVFEARI